MRCTERVNEHHTRRSPVASTASPSGPHCFLPTVVEETPPSAIVTCEAFFSARIESEPRPAM
jgi:hypothetical protein